MLRHGTSIRDQLLMTIELNDKPWFFNTATRESAEQKLSAAPNGRFLVRPSSQPGCYAMSLKNQDGAIVHVVVGTSYAKNDGVSKRAFWIEIGGVPHAFDSIDAVADELGVVPLAPHGTLASSLALPPSDSNSAKARVQYQKLPRASLMIRMAEDESDYGALQDVAIAASASTSSAPQLPVVVDAASLREQYVTRSLPRVRTSSSDESADAPPLPPAGASAADASSKRESTTISVLLPDSDRPVRVRVSRRGATAASLIAPALAKRLPVSTLAATSYSFVGLPTPTSPGFIVNASVPLEALLAIIGHDAAADDDDDKPALEMWELPDVLEAALASHEAAAAAAAAPRATVLDFGVPLDRMLRVLRLRFGDALPPGGDVLLRFGTTWLQLALSLEAQGVARAAASTGVLQIHTLDDVARAVGSWKATQVATFTVDASAQLLKVFGEQRVLARFVGAATAPAAVYALEFLVVTQHGSSELVLTHRGGGAQRGGEPVLRLRSADAALVATWFEVLRRASLQSARRVFGVPLDELLRREGRRAVVPQLVHAAVAFLRGLEPVPPALFQRPGSPQLLALLRAQADGGAPLVLDALDAADAHAVASLLLEFLRELPEPPVTWALVAPLCVAAERVVKDLANRADAEARFAELLGKLPAENADLLRFVCDFLNELSARQRVSVEKLGFVCCGALVRRPPTGAPAEALTSAVYYRRETSNVLGDLAPPEPQAADSQQIALATKLIQLSSRIPGPRGVARIVAAAKARSRGRARSDALSHVPKASATTFENF